VQYYGKADMCALQNFLLATKIHRKFCNPALMPTLYVSSHWQ